MIDEAFIRQRLKDIIKLRGWISDTVLIITTLFFGVLFVFFCHLLTYSRTYLPGFWITLIFIIAALTCIFILGKSLNRVWRNDGFIDGYSTAASDSRDPNYKDKWGIEK
jgi:hypothetical protein